jgi:dipeptidase E
MKKMIIASSSVLYGGEYLEYLLPTLKTHFHNIDTIVFIPYARSGGISYNDYTDKVSQAFAKIEKKVVGLHTFNDPQKALTQAEGIFTGGGNTFALVQKMYELNLWESLKKAIENGVPYLGCSAGSNITGISMQNTNDMPIVYPPSFQTLGAIPFNINPHYLDPDSNSTHMGETRETRIKEFHVYNELPVLGIREGSWLEVAGRTIVLRGNLNARLFKANQEPTELPGGSDLSSL